jgi:capsular polysaccharide transport system permease protein
MERARPSKLQETALADEENCGTRVVAPVARSPSHVVDRILGNLALQASRILEVRSSLLKKAPLPRPPLYFSSFILFVIVPSLFSFIYLVFIASDQYVAEARFAVSTMQTNMSSEKLTSAISATGASGIPIMAGQEAYIVASYIRSRAIIEDLSMQIDLRKIFRRSEADLWARLKRNATAEELVDYWNGMVTTYVDGPSGVVTVAARAFRPADAVTLSRAIIRASEKLVNDVSARARNDVMRRAEEEVRRYERAVRESLENLRKYRDLEGFIDPVSAASSTSQLLIQAMSEKIRLQSDFFVSSKAMSTDAPTIQTLKSRLESVDAQIEQLKSKLTGNSPDGRSVADSLVKFEDLELKRTFAEKLYTIAQDSLERARVRAEQQNIYLSVFVQPSLPQDASYPERTSYSLLIPVGLLVVWGIFALIAAAIEDHRI